MEDITDKHTADLEKQDDARRGSRVGGTLGGPTALKDDEDSALSVGKQMELEASNSIKYRTCSWQKVPVAPFGHISIC